MTDTEQEAYAAVEKAQKAVWAEVHGQDPQRLYTVSEVKGLVYALDSVISGLVSRPAAPAVVHHHDIEKHAEHFNEGWDEAHRQGVGGNESREWLVSKVEPILTEWVDTAYRTALAGYESGPHQAALDMRHLHLAEPHIPAGKIADALLSDADLTEPASPATREAVTDVLVMTRLSDFAGTDIRVIEGAADALLVAFDIRERSER